MFIFLLFSLFLFRSKELKVFIILFMMFDFYSSSFYGPAYSQFFMLDELSFSMVFLTSLIMISVILISKRNHFLYSLMYFFLIIFFLSNSLILFLIMFECSLLPIYFLILLNSVNPERFLALKYMLMFTLISASPFFLFSIWQITEGNFFLISKEVEIHPWLTYFYLAGFLVKIPIFFLHSWLPKAHVEATLEGSIILASLLLKMGMYGLIRILFLIDKKSYWLIAETIYSVSVLGSLMAAILSIMADDMKMSVAFSSISHMNICLANMMTSLYSSLEASVIIMVSHGLSSSLLFFFVTLIYQITGSRSALLSKGSMSFFSVMQTVGFIIWSMNISIPPLFSFIGEMVAFGNIFLFYPVSMIFLFFYFVSMSFFSMMNFSVQNHSSYKSMKGYIYHFPILSMFSLYSILSVEWFFFNIFFYFFIMISKVNFQLTSPNMEEVDSFTIFICLCLVIILLLGAISSLFVSKMKSCDAIDIYECGFDHFGEWKIPFYIHFFHVGILFLLFDLELVVCIPLVYLFVEKFWSVYWFVFFFIIYLGLMVEMFYHSLDWKE